ncbi:hypothetical protein [Streptomyces sp. NPDC056190]|uniref:hypothetical protein n=1 Tax=unclassified Streptomyces TaxID=2593676 RepID=UPI0035E2D67B
MSAGLVAAVECRDWLFSTDGSHGHAKRTRAGRSTHPAPEAVARILLRNAAGEDRPQPLDQRRDAGTGRWIGSASTGNSKRSVLKGPGPLHVAEVVGPGEKTAMRYADSAWLYWNGPESARHRRWEKGLARLVGT